MADTSEITADLGDLGDHTILVVEDEPSLQQTLVQLLAHAGYESETASSCSEARGMFEEGRYACALVDLGLPDGSGIDLLQDFTRTDPTTVYIVLTGQSSSAVIIDTMRAGAFDFLQKPVDATNLVASISRAISHFAVVRERAELFQLLMEERDQLKIRVDEATAGLRVQNERLRALLNLSQIATGQTTAAQLLTGTFTEIEKHLPLICIALCDVQRQKLLAVFQRDDGDPHFIRSEGDAAHAGFDTLLAEADPKLLVQHWVERNTGVDTSGLHGHVFTHSSWNRSVCTIGFYLDPGAQEDDGTVEFLDMCAHFLAYEWDQSNLLLQNAHHASLGNIAIELARNFVQPLTAISTATDIIEENAIAEDVQKGIKVVKDNMNRLLSQTQEFRKLSLFREDSIETVRIDEYVDQALEMLAVAIQNRNVTIEKEFEESCECVLLNGASLARTILDLMLNCLRSVDVGATIFIRLRAAEGGHIALEISHEGLAQKYLASRDGKQAGKIENHPSLQLANRTVHTCGGHLSIDTSDANMGTIRIVLSRNATDPSRVLEPVR